MGRSFFLCKLLLTQTASPPQASQKTHICTVLPQNKPNQGKSNQKTDKKPYKNWKIYFSTSPLQKTEDDIELMSRQALKYL